MVVVRPWKLPFGDDDLGAVGRDALDAIAPAPRRLQRGLDRLGAGVHRQRRVEPGHFAQLLQERPEPVGVERARRDCETARLRLERGQDARMPVPVAHGGIGAHHVDVAVAVDIPEKGAFPARQDHRKRVIIVGGVALLELDRIHHGAPLAMCASSLV